MADKLEEKGSIHLRSSTGESHSLGVTNPQFYSESNIDADQASDPDRDRHKNGQQNLGSNDVQLEEDEDAAGSRRRHSMNNSDGSGQEYLSCDEEENEAVADGQRRQRKSTDSHKERRRDRRKSGGSNREPKVERQKSADGHKERRQSGGKQRHDDRRTSNPPNAESASRDVAGTSATGEHNLRSEDVELEEQKRMDNESEQSVRGSHGEQSTDNQPSTSSAGTSNAEAEPNYTIYSQDAYAHVKQSKRSPVGPRSVGPQSSFSSRLICYLEEKAGIGRRQGKPNSRCYPLGHFRGKSQLKRALLHLLCSTHLQQVMNYDTYINVSR